MQTITSPSLIIPCHEVSVIKSFPELMSQKEWLLTEYSDEYKHIFSVSPNPKHIVGHFYDNSFFGAIHYAYAEHKPLVLSPDIIWLAICQGFGNHISENAEVLRSKFVSHQGKKPLMVSRNFVSKEVTYWEGIFEEIESLIAQNTHSDAVDLVSASFSTTTKVERTAFQLTLMNAMKSYTTNFLHISLSHNMR
jgi:Domain of unknown function (DUF4419)